MEENKDTSIEKQWRCRQCGYTYFGTERQYECPQCGWIEAHYDYKQAYFDMVDKYKRDILSISLNERDKTLTKTTKWYEFFPDNKFKNFLAWSAVVLIGAARCLLVVDFIFCAINHL